MASTSTKDIKNRIKSVENTGQITKAMELVATSKLRRAKIKVETTRPFFEILSDTLDGIKANVKDFSSPFLSVKENKKTCVIVIGGDRGLAGGYNVNVFKAADKILGENDSVVYPIGKKATEYYERLKTPTLFDMHIEADDMAVPHCYEMGSKLAKEFKSGSFDRLFIVYTKFNSMLNQEVVCEEILPLVSKSEDKKEKEQLTIYEPSAQSVFDKIVPQYISGVVYAALCESLASEHAARRMSMESASKNAMEMIDDLTLKFNRARQAAITQEITEIVSGAETNQ